MTNKLSQALTPAQRRTLKEAMLVAENEGPIHDAIQKRNWRSALDRVGDVVMNVRRRHCPSGAVRLRRGDNNDVTATFSARVPEAIFIALVERWNPNEASEARRLHARAGFFISYEDLLANPTPQPEEATIPSVISANAQAALDELNKLIESDTPPKFLSPNQINKLTNSQSENPTMTNDITIVNQTLINGKPLSSYSDSQVYDLIAQAEKKIADLEAIKTKPARLKKEIAERRAALDALIKVLDEADPKSDLPAAIA